jgi:hypothetical protein
MQLLPLKFYSEQENHVPLKVGVFRRIEEMKVLVVQMAPISEFSSEKKKNWLDENEEMLRSSLEYFSQYVSLEVNKDDMDSEMMKLLTEYASILQEFTSIIQSLLSPPKSLRG